MLWLGTSCVWCQLRAVQSKRVGASSFGRPHNIYLHLLSLRNLFDIYLLPLLRQSFETYTWCIREYGRNSFTLQMRSFARDLDKLVPDRRFKRALNEGRLKMTFTDNTNLA